MATPAGTGRPSRGSIGQLVANLLTEPADRVISADLHPASFRGSSTSVDNLTGIATPPGYFREVLACDTESSPPTIVAPDVGGVVRARKFAGILKTDLAVVDKRRSHEVANLCEVMDVIGDVQGKTAIMVDDIIDTAGTICNAAALLKERGAVKIFACATHGVLSGPALHHGHSAIDRSYPVIRSHCLRAKNRLKFQLSIARARQSPQDQRRSVTAFSTNQWSPKSSAVPSKSYWEDMLVCRKTSA